MLNFKKINPVGAELFYADGRTDGRSDVTKLIVAFLCGQTDGRSDMTKLTVAFRNFANVPKN
jgi:hypothetical protein